MKEYASFNSQQPPDIYTSSLLDRQTYYKNKPQ